jgi:hypothetical protein
MTMRIRVAGLLLLGMSCLPWHVAGQETPRGAQAPAGGWIGISVEFTSIAEGGGVRTAAVITQVFPGSPAQGAGIQVGDTLVSFDGQAVSERSFTALPGTLRAGDLVRFTVRRGGRSRDLLVEAAPRPSSFPAMAPNIREMVVRLDTVRGAILQNLDSLRLSIAGLQGATLQVDTVLGSLSIQLRQVAPPGDWPADWTWVYRQIATTRDSGGVRSPTLRPGFIFPNPEHAFPFEVLAVRTPVADSLRGEITRLREGISDIRRQQLSRQRELEASLGRSAEERILRDGRLAGLQRQEKALLAQQEALSEQLRRLSDEEIKRQWARAQSLYEQNLSRMMRIQSEAQERLDRERREAASRTPETHVLSRGGGGSPVIVGQSVMLGAHLAPLNPDLAALFSVPEGVFVIHVPAGTPAADAGLVGGDIIVRIGDEKVASLADLRFGLASPSAPIRIQVIRRGQPVEVAVRR